MNTQIDLSKLRGLHIPSKPGIFPLPLGWWLIIICIVLLIVLICFGVMQYFQSHTNILIKELRKIKKIQNTKELLIQMNELAKKVAIAKLGREKVASLYGKKWIDFLNSGNKEIFSEDYVELLHKTLYTKNYQVSDSLRGRIIKDYSKWIKSI